MDFGLSYQTWLFEDSPNGLSKTPKVFGLVAKAHSFWSSFGRKLNALEKADIKTCPDHGKSSTIPNVMEKQTNVKFIRPKIQND